VLQSHGRVDPILPYAGGVLLREMMIEAGLEVEWVEFNGGHGIPPGVLERLAALVARTTGDVR
jgi:phospholipase/carboxylesterase